MQKSKKKGGVRKGRDQDSKSTYDAVEFGTLVALRTALRILGLACAELAEVLSGFGNDA